MPITVADIWYAPLKSAKGRSIPAAEVGPRGIKYDREWVVVNEDGMFVAQRQSEGMGIQVVDMRLIEAEVEQDGLRLSVSGMETIYVPGSGQLGSTVLVQIWKTRCLAQDQGARVSKWLSTFLSTERPGKYRLCRIAGEDQRVSRAGGGARLAFADAYPFMNISQASLDDLNHRLVARDQPSVPMSRFRPNIVFAGCEPYEEDHFARIRINDVVFVGRTLCERCPIPCTDQDTGKRFKEPNATLAQYRRGQHLGPRCENHNGVFFGRNFNHLNSGTIRVGDVVEVLERD